MRQKIVVCGEKLIAERCLDFLRARDDTEVAAVVCAENDWQVDLIRWADRNKIRTFVGNINTYHDELDAIAPDFLFSIQYRALLKDPILRIPARGCLNLHFGLLPRYGGCHPIAWAILNGEEQAGVTLHYMTPRFDEGDIVAQQAVMVDQTTTARRLFDDLSCVGVDLFEAIYPDLIAGKVSGVPQDLSRRLYYSKQSIDFEKDSLLDWSKPGSEIQRRICAFSFEPFQLPRTTIRIGDAKQTLLTVAETRVEYRPCNGRSSGEVVAVNHDGSVWVSCVDESLIRIGKLNGEDANRCLAGLSASLSDVRFV